MSDVRARRFAVIGDPIAHSLSPAMHRAALAELGLPHTYEALRVPEAELPATLDRLRRGALHGLNVTVPHKVAVRSLCDASTPEAIATGACNTLWVDEAGRLVGANTDVEGLSADLRRLGAAPRAALVLGAGGAARAAVLALDLLGAEVTVAARRDDAAAALARSLGHARASSWLALEGPAAGFDLVVNATSAGMAGTDDGAPIAAALARAPIAAGAIAYDLVYRPPAGRRTTEFLARAEQLGLRAVDGVGMLVEQGARALSIFLSRRVTDEARDAMRAAVLRALGR